MKQLFLNGVLLAILLAAVSVSPAPAPAQEWDGRLWKPYQPQQFGGQRRSKDGVYGGVEAIVWNVNRMSDIISWFPSMDFRELDSDFRAGTKVTFGNRVGHHGWRCSYYGISGLGGSLEQDVSVDWSQKGELGEYPMGGTVGNWSESSYLYNLVLKLEWVNVQTQIVSVKTSTRVSNLDLAYTYRAHPFRWGELELYAGAKYWDFKEKLVFSDDNRSNVYRYSFWEGAALTSSSAGRLIFGDSNGRLVTLNFGTDNNDVTDDDPTPLSLSVLRTRLSQARNRITGANFGATITRRNQRWTFGADAAVFLGVNGQSYSFREGAEVNFYDSTSNRFYSIMQTNTSGSSDGGTREANELSLSDLRGLQLISSNIDGLDGATYYRKHRTVFSPGVSMQLSAQWQWTDAIGVKVAFDSTIIDNVARGSTLVATPNMVDTVDSGGNVTQERDGYNFSLRSKGDVVLLYGVTFGLEFRR